MVAHGVRSRAGKGRDSATTFASGELVLYFKEGRDLHTMREFTASNSREGLGADLVGFAGATAIAELIAAFTQTEESAPIFDLADELLDGLELAGPAESPELALSGLWRLVAALGFAPRLDECTACGSELGVDVGRFDVDSGGMRCGACSDGVPGPRVGPGARLQLQSLLGGAAGGSEGGGRIAFSHSRAHLSLLTAFVARHLVGRRLDSLTFLAQVFPTRGADG